MQISKDIKMLVLTRVRTTESFTLIIFGSLVIPAETLEFSICISY